MHINLAGIGIGNGLTDPTVQYQYYPQMAMNNTYGIKTVSEEAYDKMVERLPLCIKLSEACQRDVSKCVGADDYCNVEETTPYYKTGLNPYDIRKPCDGDLCYNFDNVDTFLNLNSTFAALHVSDKVKTWESCNNVVNAAFASDWMREFQGMIPPMLESGVRALIYAGDADFICNWMGNHAWTNALPWSGHDQYSSAVDVEWTYGSNVPGGMTKTAPAQSGGGSLTFLRVYGGGHMVPMDQPAAAFAMLETFLKNESFESE